MSLESYKDRRMASQITTEILDLLKKLEDLLSCVDPNQDQLLIKRRNWIHQSINWLMNANSQNSYVQFCRMIKRDLRGGMGSFMDIHLYPARGCKISEKELNLRFQEKINQIYIRAYEAIKEM
jgi:hypothetical protein